MSKGMRPHRPGAENLKQRLTRMGDLISKTTDGHNRLAADVSSAIRDLYQRTEHNEQVVCLVMDNQAVMNRLLYRHGVTFEDRRNALLELNACKEFAALMWYIADVLHTSNGVRVMEEIVKMNYAERGEPYQMKYIMLAFIAPPMEGTDGQTEVPVLTLKRMPNNQYFSENGEVIDGVPPTDAVLESTIYIHPKCFQPLLLHQDSPERLYGENLIGVSEPRRLLDFLRELDLKGYIARMEKQREEEEAKEEAAQSLADPHRVELDPRDFATSDSPQDAIIFGGDLENIDVTDPSLESQDQHKDNSQ